MNLDDWEVHIAHTMIIINTSLWYFIVICDPSYSITPCKLLQSYQKTKYDKIPPIPFRQITLNSSGLSYSAISLLSTLFILYGCIALNKFQLDWRIGVTCALTYVGFLVFAAIIELNVLFVVNLPICTH